MLGCGRGDPVSRSWLVGCSYSSKWARPYCTLPVSQSWPSIQQEAAAERSDFPPVRFRYFSLQNWPLCRRHWSGRLKNAGPSFLWVIGRVRMGLKGEEDEGWDATERLQRGNQPEQTCGHKPASSPAFRLRSAQKSHFERGLSWGGLSQEFFSANDVE